MPGRPSCLPGECCKCKFFTTVEITVQDKSRKYSYKGYSILCLAFNTNLVLGSLQQIYAFEL